ARALRRDLRPLRRRGGDPRGAAPPPLQEARGPPLPPPRQGRAHLPLPDALGVQGPRDGRARAGPAAGAPAGLPAIARRAHGVAPPRLLGHEGRLPADRHVGPVRARPLPLPLRPPEARLMSLLHPAFLIGLVAVAAPIVIHLIFQTRARVVLFP